ncbi:hypothetical protein GCM10010218_27260 [Streptomyces mashuensis]|uniref:HTH marR-type domain-containing protein n=1 Tax=Streptomyces mashuensis TaxID=33904 RepID=A0A919B2N2_9ACTN|nr:MarR family winged helix-turn-helix transcriptional regulator [Streptomyces mashuensis]GHF44457.1 hypothetical protein GCM10010218_27260 [Streptomyces mashuensis]
MTTTKLTIASAATENLAGQPIGYWSWAAHKAVIRHIRSAMAKMDLTQPQWWVLNRIEATEGGLGREEARELLSTTLDEAPDEIDRALDSLVARGWVTESSEGEEGDGDRYVRYVLTDAGRAAKERIFEVVVKVREEIHAGITDEEYVAALSVLRRMISNVGADELLSPGRWTPKR